MPEVPPLGGLALLGERQRAPGRHCSGDRSASLLCRCPPHSALLWGGSPLPCILQGPSHLCLSVPHVYPTPLPQGPVPLLGSYLSEGSTFCGACDFPPHSHPPAGLHPQLPSSRVALRSLGAISRKLPESQRHPAVTPPSANLATPHPCPPSPSLDESLFPQDWHWDQM